MAVVSFKRDIAPLFDPETDIPHMAKLHVMLADYGYMSDPGNAQYVLDHLTGAERPIMPPPPAKPWTASRISLFKAWIKGGYQP